MGRGRERARLGWLVLGAVLLVVSSAPVGAAQLEGVASAGEVWRALEKLRVLGSVLYIAAHPDDENTAMLAYFARGRQLRTAYLSLTRGDGGQNLIGPEQAPLLGVIRTEELLAARRIDGAEQFFTRAVDFGYSKTAAETLAVWGREAVLSDVVRVMRTFRPDVVITRFPATGDAGHGHHTASAMLAAEAFAAAGDARKFPEQVAELGVWSPRRLFWNSWRAPTEEGTNRPPRLLTLDLGVFDPVLGVSYAELAARARSMHKSQGFGAAPRRGAQPNYLEQLAGDPATHDPLEGIDISWGRVPGGKAVEIALVSAQEAFSLTNPAVVLPHLLRARRAMAALAPSPWVEVKRRELDALLLAASGVWLEAVAEEPSVAAGGVLEVKATAINRGGGPVLLRSVTVDAGDGVGGDRPLPANQPITITRSVALSKTAPVSAPEWLQRPPAPGLYQVPAAAAIGGEPRPPITARFVLVLAGEEVEFSVPVVHRTVDPVRGERLRLVRVVPPVTVALDNGVIVFPSSEPRWVRIRLSAKGTAQGVLRLHLPPLWRCEPGEVPFALPRPGVESTVEVKLFPPSMASKGTATVEVEVDGQRSSWRSFEVDYDHLPPTTVLLPAQVSLVHAPVQISGRRIGYVMGAGDEVPEVLRQLGYEVRLLADADVDSGDLQQYEAIVIGVRAYNTRDRLAAAQARLLAYVEKGGTLVVQYNTSRGLLTEALGPYPLSVGRDRVTVEDSPVTLLVPDHPVLRYPNPISKADFDGWMQERGLHFPSSWDLRYDAPLALQDPGEKALQGGLLVGRYGQGVYVYTSLAFFRQLPAGVPGALRLFANLLAGGRA